MSGEFTDLLAVIACGAVVAAAEAVTIPLLRRAAIIDMPGQRSSHTVPTPRGGGIPIAAGLLVAAGLIGGATRRSSPLPWSRSVCSGSPRTCAGWRPAAADHAGGRRHRDRRRARQRPGGARGRARPAGRACRVWITGFVNVFNFMDGVNGISGAHALIAGVVYRVPGVVAARRVPGPGGRRGRRQRARLPAVECRPGPGVPGRRGQLRAGRGPGVPGRLRRPARDPRRGRARSSRALSSPIPPGRCSGASGPASAGLSRTARTSTSGGATSDGRTSG